jgi:hypothetical protein
MDDATLLNERPGSTPHPSVIVREMLADGSEIEVVWASMPRSQRAKLVTIYFLD